MVLKFKRDKHLLTASGVAILSPIAAQLSRPCSPCCAVGKRKSTGFIPRRRGFDPRLRYHEANRLGGAKSDELPAGSAPPYRGFLMSDTPEDTMQTMEIAELETERLPLLEVTSHPDNSNTKCITCKAWKRRGCELIGVCSHPDSTCNADHPRNAETRRMLYEAGEDFRRFFWSAEDHSCPLYEVT